VVQRFQKNYARISGIEVTPGTVPSEKQKVLSRDLTQGGESKLLTDKDKDFAENTTNDMKRSAETSEKGGVLMKFSPQGISLKPPEKLVSVEKCVDYSKSEKPKILVDNKEGNENSGFGRMHSTFEEYKRGQDRAGKRKVQAYEEARDLQEHKPSNQGTGQSQTQGKI